MNAKSYLYASGRRAFAPLLLWYCIAGFCLITGCEKESQNKPLITSAAKKFEVATILEGVVADDHGPVKAGTVKAIASNEQVIASTRIQGNGHYRIQIPANTVLPIVLSFHPELKQADAKEFVAAVVHPNLTHYEINPLSTAIAMKAQALGGYTHANLVMAAESMGTVPDSNKTTSGFRGDPTKQYGGWH